MILHTTHDNRLAFQVGKDTANITVHFVSEREVVQERTAIFRRKTVCTRILASDCDMPLRYRGLQKMQSFQDCPGSDWAHPESCYTAIT